ncbi:MAG TPA: ATP-dependent helicase [Longimicrobium sp.]
MGIRPEQIAAAQETQFHAAHDSAPQIRVVAGPGTGKSFAIGERVFHLLTNGVDPKQIAVVSFTRAAARDLALRIEKYLRDKGNNAGSDVSVTTLHSLALRMLRKANLLTHYPASPLVLDTWEVDNVYDEEFNAWSSIGSTDRCDSIRSHHEAFWSTGVWGPPNYIPPDPPISDAERESFQTFHAGRSQLYCCVLPGEIIRQCLQQVRAGVLDPIELLSINHLIVDEFQDLNPMDLELVEEIIRAGATTLIAGDDDQSIYSFRFASPEGIQTFPQKHPQCTQHTLVDCLRCTPSVLSAAQALIRSHSPAGRIGKILSSAYAESDPPVQGVCHRWRFKSEKAEARVIAESCRGLISAGVDPRQIMILLSNRRLQTKPLAEALEAAGVEFEPPKNEGFIDSDAGRAVHSMIRIACDKNDYTAHRVILGVSSGVGVGTCKSVGDAVLGNNLNFRDLFYGDTPAGVFKGRAATAVANIKKLCATVTEWQSGDLLADRADAIRQLLAQVRPATELAKWDAFKATLPSEMNLSELRDFLWADNPGQQSRVLEAVYHRVGKTVPEEGLLPKRVRVMTMHSAKGLDAQIVFTPGLEDQIIPGHWRAPYPGLVFEAARLLFVSITRARAAWIGSYAKARMVYGSFSNQSASRFCAHLGGPFSFRETSLSGTEVAAITASITAL